MISSAEKCSNSPVVVVRDFESSEFEYIVKRVDYAIKNEGKCVFNKDDATPWVGLLSELFPNYLDENCTFEGWNGMRRVTMIVFSGLSELTKMITLKKLGFKRDTMQSLESHRKTFSKDSIAIQVEMTDSICFEYIVNNTNYNNPKEKRTIDSLPGVKNLNRDYKIKINRYTDEPEISFQVAYENDKKYLIVNANPKIHSGTITYYLKYIENEIKAKFKDLKKNPNKEIFWQSNVRIEFIEDALKREKQRQIAFKDRWRNNGTTNHIEPITYRGKPEYPEIKVEVNAHRGRRIQDNFACSLCGIVHFEGYLYNIRGYEVNVCKFCYEKMRGIKPYIKIINTNMGGKR